MGYMLCSRSKKSRGLSVRVQAWRIIISLLYSAARISLYPVSPRVARSAMRRGTWNMTGTRRCMNCGEILPTANFALHASCGGACSKSKLYIGRATKKYPNPDRLHLLPSSALSYSARATVLLAFSPHFWSAASISSGAGPPSSTPTVTFWVSRLASTEDTPEVVAARWQEAKAVEAG